MIRGGGMAATATDRGVKPAQDEDGEGSGDQVAFPPLLLVALHLMGNWL